MYCIFIDQDIYTFNLIFKIFTTYYWTLYIMWLTLGYFSLLSVNKDILRIYTIILFFYEVRT